MTNTYLACDEAPRGSLVRGYGEINILSTQPKGLLDVSDVDLIAWADGGLVSTAPDLIRFARGLFSGKLFEQQATLDLMLEPVERNFYGLGIERFDEQTYGHTGEHYGYSSYLAYDQANDVVTVAFYNSDNADLSQVITGLPLVMLPFLSSIR